MEMQQRVGKLNSYASVQPADCRLDRHACTRQSYSTEKEGGCNVRYGWNGVVFVPFDTLNSSQQVHQDIYLHTSQSNHVSLDLQCLLG